MVVEEAERLLVAGAGELDERDQPLALGPVDLGRRRAVLVTDGTDADVLAGLQAAAAAEGAVLELVESGAPARPVIASSLLP